MTPASEPGRTPDGTGVDGPKVVSWVERRDFVQHVGALTLGAGAAGLDIDRLIALLPQAEPTGTRHIGLADVEAIEQATGEFQRQDFAQGSGLSQAAAVAQVHSVLPLLGAQATPPVRSRLLVATADLTKQAGYMSFDVNQHDAARRLWLIGLDVARAAGDPRGSDLTVFLLYDMALQAVHPGPPQGGAATNPPWPRRHRGPASRLRGHAQLPGEHPSPGPRGTRRCGELRLGTGSSRRTLRCHHSNEVRALGRLPR
ncbi:MAG: hypothetical protein ACRDRS_13060 [Pseudonocardiaceae bacterium]